MRQEIRKLRMSALLAVIFLILSLMFATTPGTAQLSNMPPVASFTYYPNNPVTSQTITFDASSSIDHDGSISGYAWHFGDGSPGIFDCGKVIKYAYASAGTYVVTLNVWDDKRGRDSKSVTISVGEAWSPWPMFQHDKTRTGLSDGGINTTAANLRWTFSATPAPQELSSSPVTSVDGTIYFGSTQLTGGPCGSCPKVYAIWPWGVLRWSQYTTEWGKISTAGTLNPVGSKIYFGTHESSGTRPNVFAFDAATGAKLWSLMLPDNDWVGTANPVAIHDAGIGRDVIYVCGNKNFAGNYRLYRIIDHGNRASIDWFIEIPQPSVMGILASPTPAVAEDGTIYAGGGPFGATRGALYAINPGGGFQWPTPVEVATTTAESALCPTIKGEGGRERIYIGTSDYQMCAVKEDPGQTSGTVVWSPCYTNPNNEPVTTCAAIADLDADGNIEVVFASSSMTTGHVYAITDLGGTYSVLWGDPTPIMIGPTVSSPAIGYRPVAPPYQCRVFIGDIIPGNIYSLAGWNGAILAQYPTGPMLSSPAVAWEPVLLAGAAGWVFVTSNDGKLYAFGPKAKYVINETKYKNSITHPIDVSKIHYKFTAVDEEWAAKWTNEILYGQKETKYSIAVYLNETGYVTRVDFERWGFPITEIPYELAEQSLAKLPPWFAVDP